MPEILRFTIRNYAIGWGLAAIFTGLILWLNVANIGHLVTHVQGGWLAGLVFFALNGIVFAGAQVAVAVLLMSEDA